MKQKISAIYAIITDDMRVYIGSSRNVFSRFTNHITSLKNNHHHNSYLQRYVNKYGIDNITLCILEFVDEELLAEKEQYYINFFESENKDYGFNCPGCCPYNMYTFKQKELSKEEFMQKLNELNK
jgi:group I intron endonuclease